MELVGYFIRSKVTIMYCKTYLSECSIAPVMPDKQKVKVLPITGHEGPEGEYRYSSTLS